MISSLAWASKRQSSVLLRLVNEGDLSSVESFLQANNNLDLLSITDAEGNTALHFAAVKGHVGVFYRLLKYIKIKNPEQFSSSLQSYINKANKTPLHDAAFAGITSLFTEPNEQEDKDVWCMLQKEWLHIPDQNGNSILHHAIVYDVKSKPMLVKQKKQIVKQLLEMPSVDVNQVNAKGETALHLAAQYGCIETSKPLLRDRRVNFKLKTNEQKTIEDCANQAGHQRLYNAICFYEKKSYPKLKEKKCYPHNVPTIIDAAKNPNIGDDDFINLLAKEKSIEFEYNAQTINIIDLRIATLRKKHRSRNIKSALLGALCPAIAAAAFFGGFGGLGFTPATGLLSSLLTSVIFPIVYLPAAYVSYNIRSHEYGKVSSETLYKKWLTHKLTTYYAELADISKQIKQLRKTLKSASSDSKLFLQEEYNRLSKTYFDLKKETENFLEFIPNKMPKAHLKYLSKEDFKHKKNLGIYDHKENYKWVEKTESTKALISYASDVLCPVDGGITVGAAVMSIISAKTSGFAFLGAAGAGFLTGPVGIAIFTIAATLGLGILIGWALYKVSFQQERAEIGKLNRELVLAHDKCKMRCTKINDLDYGIEQSLKKAQQLFAASPPSSSPAISPREQAPADQKTTHHSSVDKPASVDNPVLFFSSAIKSNDNCSLSDRAVSKRRNTI